MPKEKEKEEEGEQDGGKPTTPLTDRR